MDIKEQDVLGDRIGQHWYYRAKGEAMRRLLGTRPIRHVLDVGAGSGVFSRMLLDHGAREASCVDPAYPAERHENEAGRPIHFVHEVGQTDADVVLLMDVLEHVDDDVGLLAEYARKAGPGARFLITVPAFAWMWSGHDVFLEHYRRYTVRDVDRLIGRAGLHHVSSAYYFGLTLPLAAGVRLGRRLNPFHKEVPGSDMRPHSPAVNTLLGMLSAAELPLLGANRLAGLSVFALAKV